MSIQYPINTLRLQLTPFVKSDGDALYLLESDPIVKRFTGGTLTRDETEQLLQTFIAQVEQSGLGAIAIKLRENEQLIGLCGLLQEAKRGEIFFGLARNAWGQGFASEACRALIQAGFEQLALERMIAVVDKENIRSIHVLERLGMRLVDPQTDIESVASELLYELVREPINSL
ncbi:MAG: GNAT family N-acetyltransferase [Caldilineaceae bacterium]